MDLMLAMRLAEEVGRLGSFSAAGRALQLSPPSVSRVISELEEHLGVRLFNRTTRNVSPTEAGATFLLRSANLMEDIDALIEETRILHKEPVGTLRVSCVTAFGTDRVAPAIPAFLDRYPRINVELDISNRKVDLINEHFDVAIRIGGDDGLADTSLIARKIFTQKLIFVASSTYVEGAGAPRTLDDLTEHQTVKQVSGSWGLLQHLKHGTQTVDYEFPDGFVVNSPIAARNILLSGHGCGLMADYLVAPDIETGRLIRVLPEYETTAQSIYAVFVHRNVLAARIRVFVDFLIECFSESTTSVTTSDSKTAI